MPREARCLRQQLGVRSDVFEVVVFAGPGIDADQTVDLDSGTIVKAISTKQDISHMLVLSSKQDRAFVSNIRSGSLSILDLATGEALATLNTGNGDDGRVVELPRSTAFLAPSQHECESWLLGQRHEGQPTGDKRDRKKKEQATEDLEKFTSHGHSSIG